MNDDVQRDHLGFEILLSRDDVARVLGLSPKQIYELIRAGARSPLPFIRVGKYLRFRPSEVRQWLEENRSAPRASRVEERKVRRVR